MYHFNFKLLLFIAAASLTLSCASVRKDHFISTINKDASQKDLSRAEYYFDIAGNYFEQNKYDEAIENLRLSLIHNSYYLPSRLLLIKTYIVTLNKSLAFEEISKILDQDSLTLDEVKTISASLESIKAYNLSYELNLKFYEKTNEKSSLWEMYKANLAQAKYIEALDILDLLEQEKESDYLLNLARSEVYFQLGKYELALTYLDLAEKYKPMDELLLKKRMQILSLQEKWSEVISVGENYFKYQKRTLPISEIIYNAALKMGSYDKALKETEWQLDFIEMTDFYKLRLGHLYFLNSKYEESESFYNQLVKNKNYSDESRFYLGLIHRYNNKIRSSNKLLEGIKADSDYFSEAQVILSEYDYNRNQKQSALSRMDKAYRKKPSSSLLYEKYTDYLIEAEEYQKALTVLETADKHFIQSEELQINRAFCFYRLKQYDRFKQYLKMSLEVNPRNAKIYEVLSNLWFKEKNSSSETEYFALIASSMGSTKESLLKVLAWTYADQNKIEKAVALFEDLYDKNPKDYFYSEMLSKIYYLSHIHTKAKLFAEQAESIKNSAYMKKSFLNKKDSVYQENKQRKPASLE